MKRSAAIGLALLLAAGMATATLGWLGLRSGPLSPLPAVADEAAAAARGAVVARAGNCAGCHTARGGARYAGGRPLPTPFGTVYSANLTPDDATGLGRWRADDLRRALHDGRSRDGRLLVPACPFDSFTRIGADDVAALYAFLRRLPPVALPQQPHALRFPYGTQAALVAWRALFFRAGRFEPDPARSAAWNRGAYLVQGPGHCAACHAPRNAWGAMVDAPALGGGLMPVQHWYAPPLGPAAGADAADAAALARLLAVGRSNSAALLGPMAEVVLHSTQHLPAADLDAIATYLLALPPRSPSRSRSADPDAQRLERGRRLYGDHCADCHGDDGRGRPGAYLPLAGNPAVLREPPANLVQVVLGGAFSASTHGNPRPFGMPPFAQQLDSAAVADVLSYVRSAWGNRAAPVSALQVERWRNGARE